MEVHFFQANFNRCRWVPPLSYDTEAPEYTLVCEEVSRDLLQTSRISNQTHVKNWASMASFHSYHLLNISIDSLPSGDPASAEAVSVSSSSSGLISVTGQTCPRGTHAERHLHAPLTASSAALAGRPLRRRRRRVSGTDERGWRAAAGQYASTGQSVSQASIRHDTWVPGRIQWGQPGNAPPPKKKTPEIDTKWLHIIVRKKLLNFLKKVFDTRTSG